jgi:hypothetical protein
VIADFDEQMSKSALASYLGAVCAPNYLDVLLDIVRESTKHDLPHYSESLRAAFLKVDPVFTRPRYAEFFWHCASRVPGYVPRVVLANGKAESEGSEKLFELWQGVENQPQVEKGVLAHAADESRHARIFVRLTELAFPGHFLPSTLLEFERSLPDVRRLKTLKVDLKLPDNFVIDHLVQMNIGEIRTRLHVHLFAPIVYGLTPATNKEAVRRLFEGLVRDEVRHISYTALLMEQWAQGGAATLIRQLYAGRLHTFNKITYTQTQAAVDAYGQGLFPDLVEI